MTVKGDKKREQILGIIKSYWIANGYAPSIRDIGWACGGMSTSHVLMHLLVLKNTGDIVWGKGIARSIRVVVTE